MKMMEKSLSVAVLGVLLGLVTLAVAAPPKSSDLGVYADSEVTTALPSRVRAQVKFVNRGTAALRLAASLQPNKRAGFGGARWQGQVPAGGRAIWTFDLQPPAALVREELRGTLDVQGMPPQALFILVEGPDRPGDYDGGPLWLGDVGPDPAALQARPQRLTAPATVSGVYTEVSSSLPRINPASLGRTRKKGLLLVQGGRSAYRIVFPELRGDRGDLQLAQWAAQGTPGAGEAELADAITDLQRCLRLMSGASLPIVATAGGPAIHLRLNRGRDWRHRDSYHLFTKNQDVVLESGHLDGLQKGIYGLLVDHLGCRWYLPGEMGEELPRVQTLVLPPINEERTPSFSSVGGLSGGSSPLWDRRNRSLIGRGRMSFGHSWYSFLAPSEKSFTEHPDWWARDRQGNIRRSDTGWSHTNFCSTSPEVLALVAAKVNERLRDPQAVVTSLDPNDYAPMCVCDRCLALDRSYGVTSEDGSYVTDRLLHFSREIYNRLEPANRDKFLGVLVYSHHMELPRRAQPHARHTGIVCNMDWVYDHTRPFTDPTSPQNRDFLRLLTGWTKILQRTGFYDYYGHYRMFGPWGLVHKMREDLPAFHRLGGSYVMVEAQPNFGMQGLNHYIAARLVWDINSNVDELLADFFTGMYGPAAGPMRSYWMAIERQTALTRPGPHAIDRVAARPAVWTELDLYLSQAEKVPSLNKRQRDRVQLARDGWRLGYYQYRLITLPGKISAGEVAATRELLQGGQELMRKLQETYQVKEGYWPSLLASYLYPGLESLTARRLRELS